MGIMKRRPSRNAFTLTELLVVMSVIIILLSMLVVCVDGIFTYVTRMQCQHQMEQLWDACLMYQNKHRILPNAWDYDVARPWYAMLRTEKFLDDDSVLSCPSSDISSEYGTGWSGVTGGELDEYFEAVTKALNWLDVSHVPHNPSGGVTWVAPCDPNADWGANSPVGTAFSLLAFTGAGYGVNHTKFGSTIEKALIHLAYTSDIRNGDFALDNYGSANYARAYINGVCTMAICDAYRLNGDITVGGRSLKAMAQKAANYLTSIQNWEGGFPYHTAPFDFRALGPTYCDMSANSWAWQGMASAHAAGLLDLSDEAAHHKDYYTDRCAEFSGAGWYRGSRIQPGDGVNPGQYIHPSDGNSRWRMTPAVLSTRLLAGMAPDDPRVQTQISYISQNIDGRNTYMGLATGTFDLYAIYYMTLSLFLHGGEQWENWAAAYPAFVLANRRTVVSADKHYWYSDGIGWEPYGSYAYPTALAAMSFEMVAAEYFPGSKFNMSQAGNHSYGYNNQIANDQNGRRTPAGDTIVLIDYLRSAIGPADPTSYIAPRHGGRVNVFFGDGHTKALTVDELIEEEPDSPGEYRIKSRMMSLQGGSDPVPVVEEP